jgi:hypothetical protein
MTTNESFERRLSAWLDESSEHRVPEHLGEVLLQTVATRQRPGWSSLERWLPLTAMVRSRPTAGRPAFVLVVLALLLLALATVAILAAGLSPKEPIRGYGANGGIYFADGTSLVTVSAVGTNRHEVATVPAGATALKFSPDGTRLAFRTMWGASHIEVLAIDRGASVAIPLAGMVDVGGPISWSPIGDQLVFVATDGQRDFLMVAAADGSGTRSIDAQFEGTPALWYPTWSPDGAWLAVVSAADWNAAHDVTRTDSEPGKISLVHPDGTGYQALTTASVDTSDAGTLAWSPDSGTALLLFVGQGQTISTVDARSGKQRALAGGFWPTWSPSGDRISYWSDGTKIVPTLASEAATTEIEVFPSFSRNCQYHPQDPPVRRVFCGPATWSPDGTRLVASDISGTAILSLLADGSGSPIAAALHARGQRCPNCASWEVIWGNIAWQPVRN